MTEDQRQWAMNRIRAKRAFWMHLAVYIVVNTFLVLIWWLTSADFFWPMWPMLGWGIGVASHAVTLSIGTSRVTEQQIARELAGRASGGR